MVSKDQSAATADRIKSFIQSQGIGATTVFVTSGSGLITALASGAVFILAFSAFFTLVRRGAGAAAVKHLYVSDVPIEGNPCKLRFAVNS